jgi:ABC-type lipoprotein export system ATPase subunit
MDDNNYLKLFTNLTSLQRILAPTIKHVVVLMGKSRSGKTTLIHYIAGSEMVSDVDDEGTDVLRIESDPLELEKNKLVVLENAMEVL